MDQPELMETARLRRLYSGRVAARAGGAGCVTPEAILAVIRREGGEDERLATLEHVMHDRGGRGPRRLRSPRPSCSRPGQRCW
jgi:hypothetical protein